MECALGGECLLPQCQESPRCEDAISFLADTLVTLAQGEVMLQKNGKPPEEDGILPLFQHAFATQVQTVVNEMHFDKSQIKELLIRSQQEAKSRMSASVQ